MCGLLILLLLHYFFGCSLFLFYHDTFRYVSGFLIRLTQICLATFVVFVFFFSVQCFWSMQDTSERGLALKLIAPEKLTLLNWYWFECRCEEWFWMFLHVFRIFVVGCQFDFGVSFVYCFLRFECFVSRKIFAVNATPRNDLQKLTRH